MSKEEKLKIVFDYINDKKHDKLSLFLKNNQDIDLAMTMRYSGWENITPLLVAFCIDDCESINILFNCGKDLNLPFKYKNEYDIVNYLCYRINTKFTEYDNNNILKYILSSDKEIIKSLSWNQSHSFDWIQASDGTLLHAICKHGDNKLLELLLK